MKRILIIIAALCLVLSLAACNEKPQDVTTPEPTPEAIVADMAIAPTQAPTPEPTATPDPRNQTERLLDAILEAEPFTYIGETFADMESDLGGLDFIDYPADEDCYFRYADLPGCWFLYDSTQYQDWNAAASKDAEPGAISVDKAKAEMLPADKVSGAMFQLSDIGMPDALMLPGIDTGIAGEVKTEESGDQYYAFAYKGYDFTVFPDEGTLAIDGFAHFLVKKAGS